jgi:hypothetical protein
VRAVYLDRLRRSHPEVAAATDALYAGTRAPQAVAVRVRARFERALARHAHRFVPEPPRPVAVAPRVRYGQR